MRIKQSRTVLMAAALGAAVALAACGGDDELAATETELSEDDRLAQLEAQLEELRAGEEGSSADAGDRTDDGDDDTDTGDDDADAGDDADPDGAAAVARAAAQRSTEPRVVEVGETYTDGAFTFTVERFVIQDYYIEIEVTAVNDGQSRWRIWNGSNASMPILFDEFDGRFGYQHIAGYGTNQAVELEPGERLDAVMVFGGRLRPQVEELTLSFRGSTSLLGWEITVPVTEVQP